MNTFPIIPKPYSMSPIPGVFRFSGHTRIIARDGLEPIGVYLKEVIQLVAGLSLDVRSAEMKTPSTGTILLTLMGENQVLGREGYQLEISNNEIVLRAPHPSGVLYSIQTLRQLMQASHRDQQLSEGGDCLVPAVKIEDQPRFRWRGMHLDVARHMYPIDFIKRFIDLMALHKLNTFHWHLTDDQGWRIEIKKYPGLTEIGSKRKASPIPAKRQVSDGVPYGGFYTQDQVREIIEYAASRFVTVIPEIELPGHALAALASYPNLGCTGGPYQVSAAWGVFEDIFCAGNEKVYEFLEGVLNEVIDLFPGEFIHIGGDEVPKDRWNHCQKCQSMIEKQGLKNPAELQSYFIKRIAAFLSTRRRRIIGWDETLEGCLAADAAVMVWRDASYGVQAARMGHDVIMCPTEYCYFDTYQAQGQEREPPAIGGFLPLEKVYAFEPIPDELNPDQTKHILGGQGNVWTEYIPTPEGVEYMAFPRATALAEVLWSPRDTKDYKDFCQRLRVFLRNLDGMGVHYRDPFAV
ncbi:MAG: beta-N-acetylhexosaminidase [Chloroflexota bacterium]|nr:beta-N-acetylhexosaminidase [Chloroflexota bacterium]